MLRGFLFASGMMLAVALVGGYLALNLPADAGADFTVTKETDGNDGVCNTDCSLREAVQNANSLAGLQSISVPPGNYVLTMNGVGEDAGMTGDIDITSDLIINGTGAVVDGNSSDRVFHVTGSASAVNFNGLTIEDGDTVGQGGGILIDSASALQLTNCAVRENRADAGGAGIANVGSGSLTVNNCTLDLNRSLGADGAALYTGGGAVSNLSNCTVSNGEADRGGGTFTDAAGVLIVNACSFIDNDAQTRGGGMFNSGQLFVTNSTTHENHAALEGGAVHNTGGSAISQIDNTTLSFDTADFGAEVFNDGGTIVLYSTILRHTSSSSCSGDPVDSEGYNISIDQTCDLNSAGDQEGVDALLAPLANYGGPTLTHMLEPGSPALNLGDPLCPAPSTDQRGTQRPQFGRCDIGSVEATNIATFTATPGPGTGTATATPTPVPPTASPTATAVIDSQKFADLDCDGDVDLEDVLLLLLWIEDLTFEQDEPCFDPDSDVVIVPG